MHVWLAKLLYFSLLYLKDVCACMLKTIEAVAQVPIQPCLLYQVYQPNNVVMAYLNKTTWLVAIL